MKDFLKSWGLLIGALGLGVLAFFVATIYLENREASLRDSILGRAGEVRTVVVATRDIEAGEPIGGDNMAVADIGAEHLSAAAVIPDEFDSFNGQILKVPLSAGEPLLTHSVEGQLIERFSDLLDQGHRAVTIEVNTLSSNAGLLSVGDYVDIFLSGEFSGSEETSLMPLFQRVKVLAVDRYPLLTRDQEYRSQGFFGEEEALEYSSVTLGLVSSDANDLAFASSIGDIVFLLRNSTDERRANFELVNPRTLLSSTRDLSSEFSFYSKQGVAILAKTPSSSTGATGGNSSAFARSVPIISQSSGAGALDESSASDIPETVTAEATNQSISETDNESAEPETSKEPEIENDDDRQDSQ